jgi:hypothetical protein
MKPKAFIYSLLILFSCTEAENAPQLQSDLSDPDCDAPIQIITQDEFNDLADPEFSIEVVSINQDCLSISISDSGCSPDNWDINLLTTDAVMESNPPQKNLKVEVLNNEACLAIFQKTKVFDLTPIQNNGDSEIILNIEGWLNPVNYEY